MLGPSRFTEEQVIGMPQDQEAGTTTANVCRKHGISSATFHRFKAKLGGMDVSDTLIDGRRFRAPAVVDDDTRKCLALIADTFLSGPYVVRALHANTRRRRRPGTIASDNGTAPTSMTVLRRCQQTGVEWHDIAPGKPTRSAFVQSFNGCFRDECLIDTPFSTLAEARSTTTSWKAATPSPIALAPRQHATARVRN